MAWQGAVIVAISIVFALLLNGLRQDGLPLPGDWSDVARVALDSGETLVIPLDEARRMFEEGEAVFLDARPGPAYEAGHIQGALSLPWESFDERLEKIMPDLREEMTLITYCDGQSCSLSHDLATALIEMGFVKARVLVNGWTAWQENGLPTAAAE
jgi:rhodanese-related sulfurtransferase